MILLHHRINLFCSGIYYRNTSFTSSTKVYRVSTEDFLPDQGTCTDVESLMLNKHWRMDISRVLSVVFTLFQFTGWKKGVLKHRRDWWREENGLIREWTEKIIDWEENGMSEKTEWSSTTDRPPCGFTNREYDIWRRNQNLRRPGSLNVKDFAQKKRV